MRALLAEGAGDEGLGVAAGPAATARQPDLGRADLGGGHVDAAAGLEAFGPAHGIGGGPAVGRAIGRDPALLMARKRTGSTADGHDIGGALGGVLGAVDRLAGRDAGLVAELLDRRTRAAEGRFEGGRPAGRTSGRCSRKIRAARRRARAPCRGRAAAAGSNATAARRRTPPRPPARPRRGSK